MKKSGIHGLISLLALACLIAPGTAVCAAETTIPVILPLTGNASFLGQGIARALKVLEAAVNKDGGIGGSQLRFVFQDDQTSPQVAVQLTTALVAQPPAVMMGSGLVAMCNAMAPLLRNGPVDYCLSPAAQPAPGAFMYSTNTSTRDLLMADFHYFKSRGWTRVATISSSDATGQDFEKGVDAALKAAGKQRRRNCRTGALQPVRRQRRRPARADKSRQPAGAGGMDDRRADRDHLQGHRPGRPVRFPW